MSDLESKKGCVGDYRAVWRFKYGYNQRIGVSECNEIRTIGWQPASTYFDVIAPTIKLAEAAWEKEYGTRSRYAPGDHFGVILLEGPTFVCYVDAEITYGRH